MTGAFSRAGKQTLYIIEKGQSTVPGTSTFSFDASRSSSIFGANTKVQPRSYYALMIIKS